MNDSNVPHNAISNKFNHNLITVRDIMLYSISLVRIKHLKIILKLAYLQIIYFLHNNVTCSQKKR